MQRLRDRKGKRVKINTEKLNELDASLQMEGMGCNVDTDKVMMEDIERKNIIYKRTVQSTRKFYWQRLTILKAG